MTKSIKINRRQQLRIIGGQWRGSKIQFADASGLRPTGDRVRETLFNWLAPFIHRARCLDLFAGSGVLGFEALSRGAEYVLAFEENTSVAAQITREKQRLSGCTLDIRAVSSLDWLASAAKSGVDAGRFDLVFLDPPFADKNLLETITLLNDSALLADKARIYLELPVAIDLPELPANWRIDRDKRAGVVRFCLCVVG